MKKRLGLIIDSSASIPSKYLKPQVRIVPHQIFINGNTFPDFVPQSMTEITPYIETDTPPTTANPGPLRFLDAIKSLLLEGFQYLAIYTVSSQMSGTYNSAILARDLLADEFNIKQDSILVVDTLQLALGHGLYPIELMVDDLFDVEDLQERCEIKSCFVNSLFLIHDISFLLRGGRLLPSTDTINAEKLWFVIEIIDGKLQVISRTNSRQSGFEQLIQRFQRQDLTACRSIAINYVNNNDETVQDISNWAMNQSFKCPVVEGMFSAALSIHLGPGAVGLYSMIEK